MTITKCMATFACFLVLGSYPFQLTHGQSVPDRFEFQNSIDPAVGGWYSPGTNFGGITFDLNFDSHRAVVGGEWQFQENGVARVVFFQSELHYSSDAEFVETGVASSVDSPTFTFEGRGDYADPRYVGSGSAVLTGRSIRIEFSTSRVGTFIDNPGQADERRWPIVGTLRGLPLVAAIDYAGDWVAISRVEFPAGKRTYIGRVNLEPFDGSSDFVVQDVSSVLSLPPAGIVGPTAGARIYRMRCPVLDPSDEDAESPCSLSWDCGVGCLPGRVSDLLWINPDESGSFASVTEQDSNSVLYDYGYPSLRTYGNNDRILIRGKRDLSLIEIELVRVATGIFPSPSDYQCPSPLPPDCATGH
jgi:hypothetical protein